VTTRRRRKTVARFPATWAVARRLAGAPHWRPRRSPAGLGSATRGRLCEAERQRGDGLAWTGWPRWTSSDVEVCCISNVTLGTPGMRSTRNGFSPRSAIKVPSMAATSSIPWWALKILRPSSSGGRDSRAGGRPGRVPGASPGRRSAPRPASPEARSTSELSDPRLMAKACSKRTLPSMRSKLHLAVLPAVLDWGGGASATSHLRSSC
jgi:hypothetical protein